MEYNLLIDGELIQTGWTTSEVQSVNVDGLSIGLHNITLTLLASNERRNDTIYVEVLPDSQQIVVQSVSSSTEDPLSL